MAGCHEQNLTQSVYTVQEFCKEFDLGLTLLYKLLYEPYPAILGLPARKGVSVLDCGAVVSLFP